MAKENVKKFYEEISTNKELQEKFMAAQEGYEVEGKSEEEIFEAIVLPIARESGYEFTVSEYSAVQREVMAEKGISEEELENVSGGAGGCYILGFGNGGGLCVLVGGVGVDHDTELELGGGFFLCAYVGIGTGGWM